MEEISRSSHDHSLKLIRGASHPYYCSDCKQVGFAAAYTCKYYPSCNFFLHTDCANASSRADHPLSKVCKFELRRASPAGRHPCDACGKTVQGLHYKCKCSFIVRYLHPSCLNYSHRLEASEGLTLHLKKIATSRCLYCKHVELGWNVDGWAYVSDCGDYCYHVACVREIINNNWRGELFNQDHRDPFQVFQESIPRLNELNKIVKARQRNMNAKKAMAALSAIFHFFTGNPFGLYEAATQFLARN